MHCNVRCFFDVLDSRRWQSLFRVLDIHPKSSEYRNMLPDDPANNFLGYSISTSDRSCNNNKAARHARTYNKYATEGIHPRKILLVIESQVNTTHSLPHSTITHCLCLTAVLRAGGCGHAGGILPAAGLGVHRDRLPREAAVLALPRAAPV